jgi:hypothetical protein
MSQWPWARAARLLACGIAAGLGIAMIWANAISWGLEDWRTYLVAAERVAAGGPVYDWSAGPEYLYRYAPWFAYALVPFLWIPAAVADIAWTVIVIGGTMLAILPLLRLRTVPSLSLALLMAGLLVRVASTGNVHPLLIGGLVVGLNTRAGPVILALAASLKAAPLLFAAVYVAERRWIAVGVTALLTAILVAPMAWLGYDAAPGPSDSLYALSPLAWGLYALLALVCLGVLTFRRSRHVALVAGLAAYLALPRAFLYDITFVLPGLATASKSDVQLTARDPDPSLPPHEHETPA